MRSRLGRAAAAAWEGVPLGWERSRSASLHDTVPTTSSGGGRGGRRGRGARSIRSHWKRCGRSWAMSPAADLLIEHLHKIQDRYHAISAEHIVALAAEMRLSTAEVFEVASFYHHFDVVKDPTQKAPAITVRVCD